ncbi:MAG: Glycerol-3-phosphate ABC transporter, permease protein UgpE, partial [uncultured Acetobacteraceae bacterium]
ERRRGRGRPARGGGHHPPAAAERGADARHPAARRAGRGVPDLDRSGGLHPRRFHHRPRRRAPAAGRGGGGELRDGADGRRRALQLQPRDADAVEQRGDGAADRLRQDRHLLALRLRRGLLQLPRPDGRLLDDLHHPHAPGGGADHPDLPGDRGPGPVRFHGRSHRAADGERHRDPPVPPVLPDGAGRGGGSGEDRRRRAAPLLPRHPPAALRDQHRGALRDPLHLRLEPIPLAVAGGERPLAGNGGGRPHAHDRHRRRAERVERHHGHRRAGVAAAGRRGGGHAAVVRARPDRDGEV